MTDPEGPSDLEFTRLAGTVAAQVREALRRRLQEHGFGESLREPRALKSTHEIDAHAAAIARESFDAWHCNLVIEGANSGEITEGIRTQVRLFEGGTEATDDLTVMAVRFLGRP